ncbi:MAG TPA: hypothetical protein DD473_27185 [Planctomycetaceae bacterium]|nr:hypothetical protein [Planctomycetaceae bacterium]|tara:strand:- start:189 stop:536 length:348 start_codon:yes stop_codon:yes gene_type:complete
MSEFDNITLYLIAATLFLLAVFIIGGYMRRWLLGYLELIQKVVQHFQNHYPKYHTSGNMVLADEDDRLVIAVIYRIPNFPVRPFQYSIFSVTKSDMQIEQLEGEEFERYRIRGLK